MESSVDFSLFALFWRATPIVKIVMLLLIGASIWSWAIIWTKFRDYRASKTDAEAFETEFWSGQPLEQLYERIGKEPDSGLEQIFGAGMREFRQSHRSDGGLMPGAQARIERAMSVAIGREEEKLSSGLTVLATVGSIAPFVGLFGTVWGIKAAFEEIAIQQSTNLAVVAPGIAEALLATALGLLAAIPAVVFYNKLSGDADRLTQRSEAFADEFGMILSRQLDREAR